MLKISIPKPCHEDWEAMTPNLQGHHCTACAKTVVDFTSMPDEAIKYFLLRQQEKTLCGRFRNEQLQRISITLPQNILQIHLPLWKQFLTACLLAFSSMLFSCDAVIDQHKNESNQTMGEPLLPIVKEKINSERMVVGGFNFNIDTMPMPILTQPVCTSTMGVTFIYDSIIKGDTDFKTIQSTSAIIEDSICQIPNTDIGCNNKTINPSADSIQTKNPPTADSTDCNNMKYY